jgi:interferon gamma-inducible protein 30
MKTKIIISLLFLTAVFAKPVVDVYIESLCPDSWNFVVGPFKDYFDSPYREKLAVVNFYVFGNANQTWNGQNWEFLCQHGFEECEGNVIETCALNYLGKKENGQSFLICMYDYLFTKAKNLVPALEKCVPDVDTRDKILFCATSEEGNKREHDVATVTPIYHSHVPWVEVGGKYDLNVENAVLKNFLEYLCTLPENQGVELCKQKKSFKSYKVGKNINPFFQSAKEDEFKFLN